MAEFETTFADLGLKAPILEALNDLGYEKPSPIQAECIPHLLDGRDVLGMAQTGSGKTAAFSLPLLNNIDPELRAPQILVLAPTRELAVQVAEAMTEFSKHMRGVNVVALYGGQRYDVQLRALRQGPQIVVGTPGRLLDHLKRGTLDLSKLSGLVLDEADEMLRMGFIEDVETIMAQIPEGHQTALFSATMPEAIRRITRRFMKEPQEVRIQSSVTTRPDISQSYWTAYGMRKNEALVRFLEAEDFDAAIIFVRTKNATLEVAEALERSGYNSAALNGDMNQALREQTLERLKDGRLDILIATDVAARGLDVERISLVVNYDIPMDSESYVHRIGRTGRAGRVGKAFTFVVGREVYKLKDIQRYCKTKIYAQPIPSLNDITAIRLEKVLDEIDHIIKNEDLNRMTRIIEQKLNEEDYTAMDIAAAFLKQALGENDQNNDRGHMEDFGDTGAEAGMVRLFINIGKKQKVRPGDILGAVAGESGIPGKLVGTIDMYDKYTFVEVPRENAADVLRAMKNTKIKGKTINVEPANGR